MSIESDLKKSGINIIKPLDTLLVNTIAKNISEKICKTFPEFNLNYEDLFIELSRINMYTASMPEGLAEANYFYKNNSIFFNQYIDENQLEEFATHECIHRLQVVKDKKNSIIRMGLCSYADFRVHGISLNEAAVQLMSSKILSTPKDYVKYFNLNFETISPTYYPLECCLLNQMAYITGENVLFESTLNSNDNFRKTYISLTSSKAFYTIQENLDKILSYEEKIIRLSNKQSEISDSKKVESLSIKIQNIKDKITNTFLKTQNLIITSYFDKYIKEIDSTIEIRKYRERLYNFKDYIASNDNYTFFNDYYVSKMAELEVLSNKLNSVSVSLDLIKKDTNIIKKLFTYFKKAFSRSENN